MRQRNRSRRIDPETWKQMCDEFGPGGFFPKESHTLVVNSPPIQNLFEDKQAEPGSVKILSKKEPEFPNQARSDEVKSRKLTHSQYIPGATLLIPYEVESLRCWAMIDTGASRSLMSLELAKTIGNPIAPNPSRLTGPIANEMPTKGIVKAQVKIGTCVASDEFVVVEDLYPEIMIGLKFMMENQCSTDLVEQKLTIPKDDGFIIKVPMQVLSGHVPPPEDDAFVCETVPGPDTVSAASETNEKLEQEVDEILNLATPGLENAEIKEKLRDLIRDYRDVFSLPSDPLGTAVGVEHRIDIGDAKPFKISPYKIAPHKLEAVREEIREMLEKGVIVPSKSPFSSPIVMVPKKDGSNRMCIDYRKLNDLTVKDAYPLPRIGQTIDALQGAGVFSSLDLASGYWQIPVAAEDRHKTAFCTPDGGLYECLKMPFGLTNAPPTFQRNMNDIFKEDLYKHVLIFLDDVLTFSKTPEEHLEHLEKVFIVLRKAGLRLKPKKCNLFRTEVHYLGHVINKEGIQPDPKKLAAVREWEPPTDVTGVRSFVAFCNYYRKFVQNFAEVARPLYLLTSKGLKFTWTEEHDKAFRTLKKRLLEAPILAFPNFELPFIIDTDASDTALGAVLSQVIDGIEYPIAFESRVLTKTEVNYATTKREALGVVQAVQWFRPYIYGSKCIIRTDHASLQWLFRQNADGMTFRMVQKLQEYDYQIVHRPGDKHCNADGLSRRPNDVPQWLPGEGDALRGRIPEFTEFDSALFEAERDLRAARTKAREKLENSEDVARHLKMQISHPPREVVRYREGDFFESPDSLVLCVSADMRVATAPMKSFVKKYSHLPPLAESVNRVGGFLVYQDVEKGRYVYILITKHCNGEVAKYDVLKESLLKVKEHASSHGISKLAMPRIGCVDDELEWVNVAICLEVVFQDSYFTISVYTPRDQEQLYPSTSARRGTPRSSSVDSACSVVTPEEMLVSEQVGGHISWTRSDSDLAYGHRMDRSTGLLFREMVKRGIRIDGTLEDLGPNPIPREVALEWSCPEALELWSNWDQLALANRVLYRKWKPSNREREIWQAVVPSTMRAEVLYQLHDSPLSGGHFAAEKTLSRIKQRFWWPGLRSSVEKYIAKCTRCAARSTAGKGRKAHLQTIEAKAPFRIVAADILGPVTLAKKSQARYILVISDLYTKYAVAVPLKDMTAKTVATTLVEEWILKFGAPDTLHTDQGTNFNSEVMKDICQVFMIDKTRTSPYHPQGNGQVERFNRVIADTISKYCAEKPQEWDLYLPHVNFVYNTTVHKTLGTTPFSMLYG